MKVILCVFLILQQTKFSLNERVQCTNLIFCTGDLLRVIQMSGIFKDSKTFVDMNLIQPMEKTLKKFDRMMSKTQGNPTKNDIIMFVQKNFQASYSELDNWSPPDYNPRPSFLKKITEPKIKSIAKKMIKTWPVLGRKVKPEVLQNPHKYSLIPLRHGFIIPGGRFREIYYWDSYWIIKGLLISDMQHTARGMIENLLHIVEVYGFVPNGGRIYYLDRSQPPLLTMMVAEYIEVSNDISWLKKKIDLVEKELEFWLNQKTITIDKNGKKYLMARYKSNSDTPRPESYVEDIHTASRFRTEDEKRQCYQNIRTGAETGWDFSARWFFDGKGGNRGDLSTLKPSRLIPVDLNAFLCRDFFLLYQFYKKIKNKPKARYWLEKHKQWREAIHEILYNEADGIWYDYDIEGGVQRKHFYPSNFAPLWANAYNTSYRQMYGRNAANYLTMLGILDYDGGIPTSLIETGEQWDFPNAWAPCQALVILGLERTDDPMAQKTATDLALKWIDALLVVTEDTHEMFEKYNAVFKGMYGGGGEYEVQTGFGWTNGFLLELIEHYYVNKQVVNLDDNQQNKDDL